MPSWTCEPGRRERIDAFGKRLMSMERTGYEDLVRPRVTTFCRSLAMDADTTPTPHRANIPTQMPAAPMRLAQSESRGINGSDTPGRHAHQLSHVRHAVRAFADGRLQAPRRTWRGSVVLLAESRGHAGGVVPVWLALPPKCQTPPLPDGRASDASMTA